MELRDKILELREERYSYLTTMFETISEDQLNLQPLNNKRSIAELLHHIGMVDGFPFFLARIVQRFFLFKQVKEAQKLKLDASDYRWNIDKGSKRIPKFRTKESLEKQFFHNKGKMKLLNYKEKHRKFRYFSERHANFHLKQLKILLQKAEIII